MNPEHEKFLALIGEAAADKIEELTARLESEAKVSGRPLLEVLLLALENGLGAMEKARTALVASCIVILPALTFSKTSGAAVFIFTAWLT